MDLLRPVIHAFETAPWHVIYDFFAKGDPPLALQLLALNTVFFVLFIIRRMRGARAMRPSAATTVQALLIFANCLILLQDDITRTVRPYLQYL
jgi:hypothetical protein